MSYDEASIKDIPGVVKVVRVGNFLGVVAKSEWGAIKAAQQLAITWSPWEGLPDEKQLWQHVRTTKIAKDDSTSNIGDSATALAAAPRKLSASYDFAIHTHGSIGPSCAVASFDQDSVTVWTASQATHNLRKQLAAMLGADPAKVRCIYLDGAGCYGRNGHEDAAADAVLLARETGQPVRVQWMRADEHGWDPKGPPTLLDMRAGIDADGKVVAWESELFIPNGGAGMVALVAADHAGLDSLGTLSPGGVLNDQAIPYGFPNIKTVAHRLETTPFRPSWIRSPGRLQNTFANESSWTRSPPSSAPIRSSSGSTIWPIRAARSCSNGWPRSANGATGRKSTARPRSPRAAAWPMSNTSCCALMSAPWPRSRSTARPARLR